MHTPGPWTYEESTKTIRSQPANYWIASMDSWDGAVNHAANARLIAVAPELLEALDRLADACAINGRLERGTRAPDYAILEQATNAIAKAKGQQ